MTQGLIDVAAEGQDAQVAIYQQDTHKAVLWAQSVIVSNTIEAQQVGLMVRQIDGLRKRIKEHFDPEVAKLHEAHKSLLSKVKALTDPLEQAKRQAGAKVLTWQTEEQQRAARAAAAAKAEAERKAAEEREALLEQAGVLESQGQAKEAMTKTFEAAVIKAAPVVVEAAPKVKGLFGRKTPKVDILDMGAVPREYCEPSESRLLAAWRASGYSPTFTVPGCKFHMDETVTTRT